MDRPNKCKWCGAGERCVLDGDLVFTCGSMRLSSGGDYQWATCKLILVERRIQRALETLKTAKRHDFVVDFMSSMQRRDDGDFVEFDDVEQAMKILEGESDATD